MHREVVHGGSIDDLPLSIREIYAFKQAVWSTIGESLARVLGSENMLEPSCELVKRTLQVLSGPKGGSSWE